jgi:two-component system NtrC family sensor kinase
VKITAKLILVFMLGIMIVTLINGYLAVLREDRIFQQEASNEARRVGKAIGAILANAWNAIDADRAVQIIRRDTSDLEDLDVRWVILSKAATEATRPKVAAEQMPQLRLRETSSVVVRDAEGQSHLFTYWPVAITGGVIGGLEFNHSLKQLERKKREMIALTLLQMACMTIVTVSLTALAGIRLVGEPLKKLTEKTQRVALGDLSRPVQVRGRDELAELAQSLNDMCDKLDLAQTQTAQEAAAKLRAVEQLRHADRLRTVGQLASGVAHELGTPLNVVAGRAALIASGNLPVDKLVESAQAIKCEAERMTQIIRQLLDFSRRTSPQKTDCDIRCVVNQTTQLLASIASKSNVEIVTTLPDEPANVQIDQGQIQQVLTNLVNNAIQAMPAGGNITIDVQQVEWTPATAGSERGEYVRIVVQDEGQGIPPENMDLLFEPFFTTKDVGAGTGLGLSITYGIILEHGGEVEVHSEVGKGSQFFVYLPKPLRLTQLL